MASFLWFMLACLPSTYLSVFLFNVWPFFIAWTVFFVLLFLSTWHGSFAKRFSLDRLAR